MAGKPDVSTLSEGDEWLNTDNGKEMIVLNGVFVESLKHSSIGSVSATGDETIQGTKTFEESPIVPTPVEGTEVVNKEYVDLKPGGFKNLLINGSMDIWQRGTTGLNANNGYAADRWNIGVNGNVSNVYRGTGGVFPGSNYNTAVNGLDGNIAFELRQYIEQVNCQAMREGDTVTLSVWVYTSGLLTDKTVTLQLARANGVDDFSVTYDHIGESFTVSEGHVGKLEATITIPTEYFALFGTRVVIHVAEGIHTGETMAFGNIQLEEGSVATPFEQRPYGLELSLCQRYYETSGIIEFVMGANSVSTATMGYTALYNTSKRVTPSTQVVQPIGSTTGVFENVTKNGFYAGAFSSNSSVKGVTLTNQSGVTMSSGDKIRFKYTADAEL